MMEKERKTASVRISQNNIKSVLDYVSAFSVQK